MCQSRIAITRRLNKAHREDNEVKILYTSAFTDAGGDPESVSGGIKEITTDYVFVLAGHDTVRILRSDISLVKIL